MRKHLHCWREGCDEDLLAWLSWYWDMGLVSPMINCYTQELGALLVVRYINKPEDFEKDYAHHKGGQICVAELLIATEPDALKAAICGLALRHGYPVYLMHSRPVWEHPKLLVWSKFERHLRKMYAFS
jgi:hypothetical protein